MNNIFCLYVLGLTLLYLVAQDETYDIVSHVYYYVSKPAKDTCKINKDKRERKLNL